MIAYMKDSGTPVAVYPKAFRGYWYRDNSGKKISVSKKTAKLLDENAIVFYRPLPLRSLGIKDILIYMKQCLDKYDFAILMGMILAGTLLGMLIPRLTMLAIGFVLDNGNVPVLFGTALFILCVSVSSQIIRTCSQLAAERIPYMYSHRDKFIPENVTVTEDDLYAYTYGTPSAAWAGTENENADKLAACNYVHNYYTSSDYTIMIAFPEWGFGKYGVNNLINLDKNQKTNKDDPEKKAQMLKLLNELAPETYKQYTDEPSKSKDPDTFAVYRFKDDGSFQTEPDPENPTGLPETLEGFTKDRLDRIRLLSDGRDSYSDNYQEAVMLLAEYLKGDYSSRPGDLITNFIGEPDLKLTCVMVALWYLVDRYMNINH